MMFARGKVVDGKVVVEGPTLEEGAEVVVLLRGGEEDFDLTPEQEAELHESMAQIDRGEFVEGFAFLDSLRR
jgi:hypothetical protein